MSHFGQPTQPCRTSTAARPAVSTRFAAWLREQGVSRVGLEASGGYETEVMDALQARGFEVIRYNAYRIRMFAKANGRLAKNDRADAVVLAHAAAVLPVRHATARQPQLDPLVELLNYRRRLHDWIGDCTNQLEHLRDKVLRRHTTARRARLHREVTAIDKKLAAALASSGASRRAGATAAQRAGRRSGPLGGFGCAAA